MVVGLIPQIRAQSHPPCRLISSREKGDYFNGLLAVALLLTALSEQILNFPHGLMLDGTHTSRR